MLARHLTGLFYAVCFICISIFAQLALAVPVKAATAAEPVIVDTRTTTLDFPKSIDYEITVHDDGDTLKKAVLTIRRAYSTYYNRDFTVEAPDKAHTFNFKWTENLTKETTYFPVVGTDLTYFWSIETSNGHEYVDPVQHLIVEDNRFSWQHIEKGLYQVNWYDRSEDFGQQLVNNTDTALQHINNNLGEQLQHKVNIWIYSTREDFLSALPSNTVEWVGGITYPEQEQTSLPVDTEDTTEMTRGLPHELSHLILHQNTRENLLPTWLDEGLAVYNQDYHEADLNNFFQDAVERNSLIRLSRITNGFPSDGDRANLAYAQSWKLVDYMYKTFGKAKMLNLAKKIDQPMTPSFDDAIKQTLGVDIEHLEDGWYRSLKLPPLLTDEPTKEVVATPTPRPVQPKPAETGNDTTTTLLLLLGGVLVVVAILGIGGVVFYQQSVNRKARLAYEEQLRRQQQHSMNTVFSGPNQAPGRYGAIGQVHIPQTPPVTEANYADPQSYMPATTVQKQPAPEEVFAFQEFAYREGSANQSGEVAQGVEEVRQRGQQKPQE